MALKRKDALRRLEGLLPEVEKHLQKLIATPNSQDASHWRAELSGWFVEMERVTQFVGKKTSIVWEERIGRWRIQAGVER